MPLTLITAPVEEPLTLQEVKDWLRLDGETEDSLVDDAITMARADWEAGTSRRLVTQTWDWSLDCFDERELASVPLVPVQSVTSIKYLDAAGAEQTLSASVYRVSRGPGGIWRITLGSGQSWPSLYPVAAAVTVRLVVGHGTREDVPRDMAMRLMTLVAAAYQHRGDAGTELYGKVRDAAVWRDKVWL